MITSDHSRKVGSNPFKYANTLENPQTCVSCSFQGHSLSERPGRSPRGKKSMRRPEEKFYLKLKSGDAVLLHAGLFSPSLFVRSGDEQEPPRRGSPEARRDEARQQHPRGQAPSSDTAGDGRAGSSPEPCRDTRSRRYLAGPGSAGPGRAVPALCAAVPRRLPAPGISRSAPPALGPYRIPERRAQL